MGPCVGEDAPCIESTKGRVQWQNSRILRPISFRLNNLSAIWCVEYLLCNACNAPNSGRSIRFAIHIFLQVFKKCFEAAIL